MTLLRSKPPRSVGATKGLKFDHDVAGDGVVL